MRRLEKTEADLVVLRVELGAERAVRERTNGTVAGLRRKLAEEKAGLEEMKLQFALVRAARRRSELQVSTNKTKVTPNGGGGPVLFWVYLTSRELNTSYKG